MLACSYIFGMMLDKIALLENGATIKHFETKLAHVGGMTTNTKTIDNLCTLKKPIFRYLSEALTRQIIVIKLHRQNSDVV